MKFLLFALGLLLIPAAPFAQTRIKLDEVNLHIGDSVTVCGLVADLRYFENSKNQPTLLNIGAKYPDQQITVVIRGDTRKRFTTEVDNFRGKQVCVTGRIILYKDKPEIIIENPEQLTITQ